jgi:hypothetical protein
MFCLRSCLFHYICQLIYQFIYVDVLQYVYKMFEKLCFSPSYFIVTWITTIARV